MIAFKNRFHGYGSLRYVYKNGYATRTRLLTVKYAKNKYRRDSRLAVVVSKKVVKSAVKRNRIRRRLYEALRHILPNLNDTYDIALIVSSSELLTMKYSEITHFIDQTFRRSDLLK